MALRRVGKLLSGVAFLLVTVYAVTLVLEGQLLDLGAALLAADVVVQVLVQMGFLAMAMGVWWLVHDAWPAIHQALGGLAPISLENLADHPRRAPWGWR